MDFRIYTKYEKVKWQKKVKEKEDMARKRKKQRRKEKTKNNWIQKAIKHPGALTRWFKRNRKRLKRILGFDPITKKGDINDKAITKLIELYKEGKIKLDKTTLRRLYLARTLKKLRKKK